MLAYHPETVWLASGEPETEKEDMKDGGRMKGSLKEQKTKKGLARRRTGKLRYQGFAVAEQQHNSL